MKKKYFLPILLIMFVLISICTVLIVNHYHKESIAEETDKLADNRGNAEAASDASDCKKLVSIYETNQYQVYKQFSSLVWQSTPEKIEYSGVISVDGVDYDRYENDDVSITVINTDYYLSHEDPLTLMVDYTVAYKEKSLTFKAQISPDSGYLTVYYVDINYDTIKDIVIIGEPFSGTNVTYYWMRAINSLSMKEFDLFVPETTAEDSLTQEQKDDLDKMLSEDSQFQKIFSDREWIGGYANMTVDSNGRIYYETSIGKGLIESIGNILILFEYNKWTNKFDVVDYIYMP